MKINITKFAVSTLLLGAAMLPLAANANPNHPWKINHRLNHQQYRINAGVKDHQLTNREEYNLDARDSRIRTIEDRDRAKDDGHLTGRERFNLERDLNHTSGAIYHDRKAGN